jgi:hypothetical protein
MMRVRVWCGLIGLALANVAAMGSEKTEQLQLLAIVGLTCAFVMALVELLCMAIRESRRE